MRRRRHLLALGLLAVLAVSAGCVGPFGPSPVDREALAADATYEWNTSRDALLTVDKNEYTAVYDVANRTTGDINDNFTMEVYRRDALGTDRPLSISALQFRYENGTRLRYVERGGEVRRVRVYPNGTTEPVEGLLAVEKTRKRTIIYIPVDSSGQVAYTAPKNGKQVATPTFVEGSYEMILPARARVGVPILAQVQPPRDSAEVRDGRVHVVWTGIERAPSVVVRYYLERDLLIFGALAAGLALVGAVGAGYYLLQIRETVRRREEVGLDVETGDDDGSGPPPGFR